MNKSELLIRERDELIRRLSQVFGALSEVTDEVDFNDADLELWVLITQHEAVWNELPRSSGESS